jgi:AraC-like DNA-binding protein
MAYWTSAEAVPKRRRSKDTTITEGEDAALRKCAETAQLTRVPARRLVENCCLASKSEIKWRLLPGQVSLDTLASSALHSDHDCEPLGAGESARIWQPRGLAGVELLHGAYRKFSFTRHFHSTPAIGVVESGIMRTYCHGRTHSVPAGSAILLNAGDVHAPQPGTSGGWSFRMFYLDDDLVREFSGAQTKSLEFAKPFFEDQSLYSSLLRLHRAFEVEADSLASESLLANGLHSIARYSCWKKPELQAAASGKLERAREYLHASYTEDVTLRGVAAAAGLGPYHFLRSFRTHIGLTPHAYLTQLRVDRARALLASGMSIADTALQSGFADQSHFTKQFKRFTGVTPGKYFAAAR